MRAEANVRRGMAEVIERVTGFCRLLRESGLRVTPAESIDAVRAVALVDFGDRLDLHLALRALLTTRRDELALFDALFAEWWDTPELAEAKKGSGDAARRTRPESRATLDPTVRDGGGDALSHWAKRGDAVDQNSFAALASPSVNSARARKDFA